MTTPRLAPTAASTATAGAARGAAGAVTTTLLTGLAPAVWGTTYLVTTELLPPGHPMFAGLVRALPVGLLAVAVTRTLPRGAWWWRSAALGVLNIGAFFGLLFVAAERLPGGVAATLAACTPVVVAVLAVPVLRERLSLTRVAWGAVGVVGVGLVVLTADASLDPIGVGAGVGAALSMGLGTTLTKRWGRPEGVGPVPFAGWQLGFGGLALLLPTLLLEGVPTELDAAAVAGYAWLAIPGGIVAYALWFRGLWRLDVTSTAMLGLIAPLVAATLGALVLGQTLGPAQLVGFALALAALGMGQLPGRRGRRGRRHGTGTGGESGPEPGGEVGPELVDDVARCRPAGCGALPSDGPTSRPDARP